MIDIHAHLLPGVDDGPETLDDAILLCKASVENGITHTICTPHILPGRFNNTLGKLKQPMLDLQDALLKNNVNLKLSLSSEVRLDFSILQLLEQQDIPLMKSNKKGQENFKYMLLEFPDAQIALGSEKLVKKIIDQKIIPIIAHPERNKEILRDAKKLAPFVEMGCKLQITASSLVGQFGSAVESFAWRLIESEIVFAVASDCHNLKGRKPKMGEARQVIENGFGKKIAESLTFLNPSQLFHEFN
jgi:protein-tyrosine phosphatase